MSERGDRGPGATTDAAETDRSLAMLARALARKCLGETALVGREDAALAGALRRRGVAVAELRASRPWPAQAYDTVLIANALELVAEEAGATLVGEAWSRLTGRGRLIVCVPHGRFANHPDQVRRFDRRRLKRLLEPLGWPKLLTDQPYKWLVMYVDREWRISRTDRDRFRAIAGLCKGRVLELGCGRGDLAGMIAARGRAVTGVDMNAEKSASARARWPQVRFVNDDILAFRSEGNYYDTVILAEVLEHVTDEVGERMLEAAWRLVAPGGRLIVSVPNEDCIPHPNHLREFTRRGLEALLKRYGRARTVAEQPFKVLLTYVDKAR